MRQAQHEQHQLALRLQNTNPSNQIKILKQQSLQLDENLHGSMQRYLDQQKRSFVHLAESLDLLSPLKIMARGYSYVTADENIIKSTHDIEVGKDIRIHLQDGWLEAEITGKKEKEHGRK